jgi:hypothetical protein
VTCPSSDAPDPRALAALAAVGLLLADRFPGVAVPSLRRAAQDKPRKAVARKPRKRK